MKNKNILLCISILIALSSCEKKPENKESQQSHDTLMENSENSVPVKKSDSLNIKSADNPKEGLSKNKIENKDEPVNNEESSYKSQLKPIGNDESKNAVKSKQKKFAFSGEVRSPTEGKLSFRTSGFISKIHYKSGEFVKKGKVISELDKTYPLINKNVAKADLRKAQVNLNQSKRDFKRSKKLKDKKAISQESFENSQTEFKNYEVSLREAKLKYSEMSNKLTDTELKAPYDGVISNKIRSEGEYVTPGDSIVEFFAINDLEVDIYLPESYLSKIKVGDKVPLYIPSSKKKAKMVIKRIVPYISKENRTFKVIGGFVSKESDLFSPGLFVEAYFN